VGGDIFGVINLLRYLHLDAWVVPSIVLIVGAHFIPLARIFQAPQHLKAAIAMMVCAAIAVVLPVAVRDTVECLSAGLILWAKRSGRALCGAPDGDAVPNCHSGGAVKKKKLL